MDRKKRFDLVYLLAALLLLSVLNTWWSARSSVEVVPYSTFAR